MDLLTNLNEKQQEAVVSTEGYLRVIAGAGSGKTKLLVSRYAYLVQEYGIDPANILCVTFTNKAAGEMKRRIRALIGQEYDTSLICTYHGFCVRVLREDIEKIFYPKEFQIIDASQQKSILSDIYQKHELQLDHASFEKILKQIGEIKARREYVKGMRSREKCKILPSADTLDQQIIEEYLQHQKQIYAMDFSDLMYFALDIFYRCPEVLEKWQDRLNYIQVDEFQDSSRVEMELVDMLSAKYKNLMIVGDPDQNIYEWRGSDVKLLVDFDKSHEPCKTVILNQNYRSTPQILKCANSLIEKNQFRLKKDLFTLSKSGSDVFHFHSKNEFAEADRIVERINSVRESLDCKYSDFAVLYRSGFLSRIIEKKFTENAIPYEIYGGVKFYHRMEIRDVLAYLRLVAFDDDDSLKRIINTPRRKFGRAKLQRLLELQNGNSLFETLREHIDDPVFTKSGAADFVNMILELRRKSGSAAVSEMVEAVCSDSGYEKYIRELGDMERFENLSEFKRIADEYEKSFGETVPLTDFINHISLQSEDSDDKESDMVKLMTIHAAKGLEFPVVFIVGLSEGVFPSSKTIEERKLMGLEEERRLCYVAITRAEKILFLMDSEGYTQNERQKLPSRFLKEIGEENYTRIGVISEELQSEADRAASQSFSDCSGSSTLNVGDTVDHPAFGKGEIIAYNKSKNTYRIRFEALSNSRDISADFFNRKRPSAPKPSSPPPPVVIVSEKPAPTFENNEILSFTTAREPDKYEQEEKKSVPFNEPEPEFLKVKEEKPLIITINGKKTQIGQKQAAGSVNIPEGYEKAEEKRIQKRQSVSSSGSSVSMPQKSDGQDTPKPDTSNYSNLWERPDVPKTGWVCTGVTDLGSPSGVCEMCGHQIIRYVHHMSHPQYGQLNVGCVCAGKMEGDAERARKREQDFKNKQARLDSFMNRKWKVSRSSNSYLKIRDHLIVLYFSKRYNNWKYSLDNVFAPESFRTREECMRAAFEALEGVTGGE